MGPAGPPVSCPRCGYDLSGVAASWREACPLQGVCSECGLSFEWGDVVVPGRVVPRWSFEHAGRYVLALWVSTAFRTAFIWPLWRGLRLEHPVVARRLTLHLAAVLLLMHGMVAAASGAWMHGETKRYAAWALVQGVTLPSPEAAAARAVLWPYTNSAAWAKIGFGTPKHLLGVHEWAVLLWVLLTPAAFVLLPQTLRRMRVRREHLWRGLCYSVMPLPLLLGVELLGEMHRRWVWPVGPILDRLLVRRGLDVGECGPALLAAAVVWIVAFWVVTVRRYLRLPHAAGVALALLAVGGLGAAVAVTLAWTVLVTE